MNFQNQENELKKMWRRYLSFDWKLGLALILLFGIPRFWLVLQSNMTGNFSLISIIFVLMWLFPFVFLSKHGRRAIGMRSPGNYVWLLIALLLGIAGASFMYSLGNLLYNGSIENWFEYIARSYKLRTGDISPSDIQVYFIIFSLIAMTFSPIGEELLYRGVIHQCFAKRVGEKTAALIDSGAFGLTHLAHFGIVFTVGGFKLLLVPGLIWIILIFCTGLLFNFCRSKSGSILGAILCHAGFNLAMTYFIFYHIY